MLANLDNEVHFKKVFTDVTVFCAFVKDVLGIDMNISKVETEKMLPNKTGAIKFRMDLFAEDTADRTVVEIQKVDYDYTYDSFSHYILSDLANVQPSYRAYTNAKEIYIIVIITSAYRCRYHNGKYGKLAKEDVLMTDTNILSGEVREMHNHKLVILNSTHTTIHTPPAIRDWLDLIKESIKNPENPQINKSKPAIVRAAELAEADNIDPEEIADAKIEEMRKVTLARVEIEADKKVQAAEDEAKAAQDETKAAQDEAKAAQDEVKAAKAAQKQSIINLLKKGKMSVEDIADVFGVTSAAVKQIEMEML